ncbi:MAG TPA: aminotransferase class I/II-fold pyridoxal phosphate-dependent enzyme [Anaerolineae bacterium]|nr:aminotransferase class I/II-fold pyridoxal phosphate-dependent enzyme [Anaerolineae bacterium]
MSQTAVRLNGLRESVIREMTRLALEHDAINLSQGYPDFAPPREIIEAAHRALDDGFNQYAITWGDPLLREAIRGKMAKRYSLHYDPMREITVTCGVTEAIIATLMGIANPGDEVILIEPYHENYLAAVVFAGAQPVFVPLEPPVYQLDLERLRRAFTPKTRAIILNTPHNPTGRVFSRQEMEGIAELCREFDTVVVTDEIYDHIVYDEHVHIPMATLDGMYERTITISGLGKTFALTGWRLGYACAPEPFSHALRTVHDFTTICAPAPLQHAAVAAFDLPDSYYAGLKQDYTLRRARMMGILEQTHLRARPPEGAYYVLADFSGWLPSLAGQGIHDDWTFAEFLTTYVGVAVVPGSSFYHTQGLGKNTVRFAFAKKLETLDAAEERLQCSLH